MVTLSLDDEEAEYKNAVIQVIQAAVRAGYRDLNDILRQCEGADPVLVAELLKSKPTGGVSPTTGANSYESLSPLSRKLPAPDPFRSQWWFSSSGISHLLNIVAVRASLFESPRILCLGVPTLAPYLFNRNYHIEVLGVDEQVLAAIAPPPPSFTTREYDASDDLPKELFESFELSILDPPWYPAALYKFFNLG